MAENKKKIEEAQKKAVSRDFFTLALCFLQSRKILFTDS